MSQSSKAGPGAIVVQSGNDTTITNGITPEDMKTILSAIAEQMPHYAAVAATIVDGRLRDFEEKVLKKFASSERANKEAFADPDFQYLLGKTQQAYARSGDEPTADLLVDLIAERSTQKVRNRLALSINEAVEKSALLTSNEFAELALVFYLRYTMQHGINSFFSFLENLSVRTGPLIPNISKSQSSYSYLEAQSCASIEIGEVDLYNGIFRKYYGGLLCKGAPIEDYQAAMGDAAFSSLVPGVIVPALHDNNRLQINAVNVDALKASLANTGQERFADTLWSVQEANLLSRDEFISKAKYFFPQVEVLFELWHGTPLKSLTLTSIGIVIGYANLKRTSGFDADLAIWVN